MSIMEYNSWKATEGTQTKKEYVAVILAALLGTIGFLGTGDLVACKLIEFNTRLIKERILTGTS